METFEGLRENFRFMSAEVEAQVKRTQTFFHAPSRTLYETITTKEGYVNNLKTIIENKCYALILDHRHADKKHINRIRAVLGITANLERISDVCINMLEQLSYLKERRGLRQHEYEPMFQVIDEAIAKVQPAFAESSLPLALRICRSEFILDALYKNVFDSMVEEMRKSSRQAGDSITTIFIYRYLERIGDHLLNVGEALIFAALGQRIKIEQFDSLRKTLEHSGYDGAFEDINFQAIWGSRSGCRIGKLEQNPAGEITGGLEHGSLYKEGSRHKIYREKQNIEEWRKRFPRLVPGVFGYHEDGDKASLLLEFLAGCSFDEIVLTHGEETIGNVLFILEQTLQEIWETTRENTPARTDYMHQVQARLQEVFQIHPQFTRPSLAIGTARQPAYRDLLAECAELEALVPAPFTVFIHGDFNTNNLIYNHQDQTVRFIDLHRSRQADYLQDMSVFLVSNFRQPVFDRALRGRLVMVMEEMLAFTRRFAAASGDGTCEARLALALARSFFTSTRFELNAAFAGDMFMRSIFLLERLRAQQSAGSDWEAFKLPEGILIY